MNLFLLQMDTTGTALGDKTSLIDMVSSMGIVGMLVMVGIFIMSIIGVYIFVERYIAIRKASKMDPQFMAKIRDHMISGNVGAAKDLCIRSSTPIARMIEKGIQRLGKPLKDISTSIENVGNLEVFRLEKGLSVLATISGAAPMLGFLGTVTGMINAFYQLSVSGNNIDPGMLAGGIYEAMLTTAFGLAVGIITFMAYNYLVSQVDQVIHKMEANTVDFIDVLQEPAR